MVNKYTIDSHLSYTYKHRYQCLQIEDVSMFVDDMKHSNIELSVQLSLCINKPVGPYIYLRRISSNDGVWLYANIALTLHRGIYIGLNCSYILYYVHLCSSVSDWVCLWQPARLGWSGGHEAGTEVDTILSKFALLQAERLFSEPLLS